ncbi:helix-turn-helix domain-containing protein [Spirosoma fluminis]
MNEEYKELSKEQSRQVCKNLGKLASDLKITQEALAAKTGYQRTSINRLFSGRFAPHLDILFCILAAINELSGNTFSLKDIDAPNQEQAEK